MTTQNTLNTGILAILMLIQRIGEDYSTHVAFENGSDDVVKSAQAVVDQAREKLETLNQQIEALALDENLSEAGRQKKAVELVAQSYNALSFVSKALQVRKGAIDEAKGRLLATPKAVGNEIVSFLQEQEVRERLGKLSGPQRMEAFTKSLSGGNPSVARAVLEDPMAEEWFPKDYLDRVMREHAARTQGGEWQRLKTLEYISDRLSTLTVALNLNLQNYGSLPSFPGKPTTHADLKTKDQTQSPPKSKSADKAA